MSTFAETNGASEAYRATAKPANTRAVGGIGFDWAMTGLGLVCLGGLYSGGWANHLEQDNTALISTWRALTYGSLGSMIAILMALALTNWWRGYRWRHLLPAGYSLTFFGALLFAIISGARLLWPEALGIQEDLEALFSPTHLTIVLGLGLVVSGPLRAAWQRTGGRPNWRTLGPALLSMTAVISILTYLMMDGHPITLNIAGAREGSSGEHINRVAGLLGILVTAGSLMGPTMLIMRRWRLPSGSLVVLWGVSLLGMTLLNYRHRYSFYQALVMLAAIVAIDLLRERLQPSVANLGGWRVFALIAPIIFFGSYFLALLLTEGSSWSVHLSTGAIMLTGLVGWLFSYLVLPPKIPSEA